MGRARWGVLAGAAVLVALVVGLLVLLGGSDEKQEPEATRIMVLGDSHSQGRRGDWTWRYRLWQHFKRTGTDVDFVGPRKGVFDPARQQGGSWPESMAYADPDFDSDHASRWGLSASWQESDPRDLVGEFHPDVVVVALGTNDLVYTSDPEFVVSQLARLVTEYRAVDPDIDFVVNNVPVTWAKGAPEVNRLLEEKVPSWQEDGSRVEISRVSRTYERRDTWDGFHPNTAGEMQLASEVADALAALGVGKPFGKVVPPSLSAYEYSRPELTVRPGAGELFAYWTDVAWADRYRVRLRDVTAGQMEMVPHSEVDGNTQRITGLVDGHQYEVQIQPLRIEEEARASGWSVVVAATPGAGGVALAAPAPVVSAVGHEASVSWPVVQGAEEYRVWWRRTDEQFSGGWRTTTSTQPNAQVRDLTAGGRYDFAVQALTQQAAGVPSGTTSASVVGDIPEAADVTIGRSPTGEGILLSWPELEHAQWYEVSIRNVTEDGEWQTVPTAQYLPRPRAMAIGLEPGEYEGKVVGFNGAVRGAEAPLEFTVEEPAAKD